MWLVHRIILVVALLNMSVQSLEDFNEDYIDSVLNLLLNNDIDGVTDAVEVEEGSQPVMANGVWVCGDCDIINENKNIYNEINQVDFTNAQQPAEIQIGVSVDGMRCVTIAGDQTSDIVVHRASGSCNGDQVVLTVTTGQARETEFIVNAYRG